MLTTGNPWRDSHNSAELAENQQDGCTHARVSYYYTQNTHRNRSMKKLPAGHARKPHTADQGQRNTNERTNERNTSTHRKAAHLSIIHGPLAKKKYR